jgi:hypothetical protein
MMLQIVASLTRDSRGAIYNRKIFVKRASGWLTVMNGRIGDHRPFPESATKVAMKSGPDVIKLFGP